ncbi:hypothetical protein AAC387_Pa09g2041 [Persea americana]
MDREEKRSNTSLRSLRQQHARSKSILLSSECISAECVAFATYERLSRSVRLSGELTGHRRKSRPWLFLNCFVFGQQKQDGDDTNRAREDKEKKTSRDKSRWSSWLPDPNRRWPVQGW